MRGLRVPPTTKPPNTRPAGSLALYNVDERVVYPGQGIARVEEIRLIESGGGAVPFYVLRVEGTGATVMVPVGTAASLGVRMPIGLEACKRLVLLLSAAFSTPTANWKDRSKEFAERTRVGDLFEIADMVKKLSYLDSTRSLGFADKRMLERGRLLIIGEAAFASRRTESEITVVVDTALASACRDHVVDHLEDAPPPKPRRSRTVPG